MGLPCKQILSGDAGEAQCKLMGRPRIGVGAKKLGYKTLVWLSLIDPSGNGPPVSFLAGGETVD